MINGRSISGGKAKGIVLKFDEGFSFLGGVDASTGDLRVREGNIAGKVFAFPKGKGSTVGSFVMYDLMVHGKAPAAVINTSAETIVTTGAVISSIPMIDSIPMDILKDGDVVTVDGDTGSLEIEGVRVRDVVSSAIVVKGKVLILHRPASANSYPGAWSLVAGKVEPEESVEVAAAREIMEETQITVGAPDSHLPPVYVREGMTVWKVYPFMYRLDFAEPILNTENTECRWVEPSELKDKCITVPLTYQVVIEMLKKSQ